MPVPSDLVGRRTDPVEHTVDARWLMAYAAGIGDDDPAYLDTRRPDGVVGHPLFPVCLEWPLVLALRSLAGDTLARDELVRGVHATHDLVLHRPIRPGDRLTTTAEIIGIERRRPGAYEVVRLSTLDQDGRPVATTDMGSLFLGVDVVGDDRPAPATAGPALPAADAAPLAPPGSPGADAGEAVELASTAAHIYTECARIWNPIHTDPAVAQAAGLPGIILHGTASLAFGISAALRRAGAGPERFRRVQARFGAMVTLPSQVRIRLSGPVAADAATTAVRFRVDNEAGAPAVDDGIVVLAGAPNPGADSGPVGPPGTGR